MKNEMEEKKENWAYMRLGLRIIGDFGASIAVPIIVFVLIGQWVDEKYRISPYATIAAFLIAAILSGILLYKKAKMYDKLYHDIDKSPPPS